MVYPAASQIRKVRPRELAHTPDVTQKSQSKKGKNFFFFFFCWSFLWVIINALISKMTVLKFPWFSLPEDWHQILGRIFWVPKTWGCWQDGSSSFFLNKKNSSYWNFPGDTVVDSPLGRLHFQCRNCGFDPGWASKILHATQQGPLSQKKKKKKIQFCVICFHPLQSLCLSEYPCSSTPVVVHFR